MGIFASDRLEGCEHRTFQVGQGSCHSMLYSVKKADDTYHKVLVFCDIGSSSRSAPIKLPFHQNSFGVPIFRAKKEKGTTLSVGQMLDSDSDSTAESMKTSGATSDTEMTTEHKEPFAIGKMTQEIEDAVKGVDSFIIMLTHPDKDHINLYTDIFGKVSKPILLICGGMWAEHKTDEVGEIRKNLNGKNNVYSIFPTYLDSLPHDAIIGSADLATPLSRFRGTLRAFISTHRTSFDYAKHFKLTNKSVSKKTFEDLVLNNIYLWSVKHITDDTNAQSLVFSCTLPDIRTSFVFTGDATPETFESIPGTAKDQLRETFKTSIAVQHHKVCFVVPHHGAVGHYSQKACDLFKPDLLLFSSGYIGSFNHPNKETLEKYLVYLSKLWSKQKLPFAQNYELASSEYKVALYDETKKKHTLRKLKGAKIVLLGTNVFGSILFNTEGIYVSGESKTEDGYYVDFRQSVAKCLTTQELLATSGKIENSFLQNVDRKAIIGEINFQKEKKEYISADKKYKLIEKVSRKNKLYYLGVRL